MFGGHKWAAAVVPNDDHAPAGRDRFAPDLLLFLSSSSLSDTPVDCRKRVEALIHSVM